MRPMIDSSRTAGIRHLFPGFFWRMAEGALRNNEGAILIEAAIILPILVMIFVGMIEFCDAFTAKRRVQSVASATAELVARAQSVTTDDLADIASVGAQLMQPFSSSGLTLKISSVAEDNQNKITEQWNCTWSSISTTPSCAKTGAAYAGIPAGILTASESVIVGQATYTFKPAIGQFLLSGVTFTSASYFRPRLTSSVPLQ
jgi:Flp pilus assembly protein TadG